MITVPRTPVLKADKGAQRFGSTHAKRSSGLANHTRGLDGQRHVGGTPCRRQLCFRLLQVRKVQGVHVCVILEPKRSRAAPTLRHKRVGRGHSVLLLPHEARRQQGRVRQVVGAMQHDKGFWCERRWWCQHERLRLCPAYRVHRLCRRPLLCLESPPAGACVGPFGRVQLCDAAEEKA